MQGSDSIYSRTTSLVIAVELSTGRQYLLSGLLIDD
jgi:hypothetical protein